VLIVLMWLCIPAAGLWLLRTDYDAFQQDSARQLEYCRTRSDHMLYFTNLMALHSRHVSDIEDATDRLRWERDWRDLEQQESAASLAVGSTALTLFPRTERVLNDVQASLTEMQRLIERAAQRQDAYNKAKQGLDAIAYRIYLAKGESDLYEAMGALGIYLMLQEKLALFEEQYKHQERLRNALLKEMELALADAERLKVDITRELGHLPDEIAADSQLTYREQLAQRFRSFDPLDELKALVMQQASAASSSPSVSVTVVN
jgi:hypothetical protein